MPSPEREDGVEDDSTKGLTSAAAARLAAARSRCAGRDVDGDVDVGLDAERGLERCLERADEASGETCADLRVLQGRADSHATLEHRLDVGGEVAEAVLHADRDLEDATEVVLERRGELGSRVCVSSADDFDVDGRG